MELQQLIEFQFHQRRFAFPGAYDDVLGKPRVACRARFEERGATEIIVREIGRPACVQRGHRLGRTMTQRMIADVNQRAVVGTQRIARLKLGYAIMT